MGLLNIIALLLLLGSRANSCPPAEEIAPHCTCNVYSSDSVMSCNKLFCAEDLKIPLNAISKHNVKLFSLTIYNSSLLFIPSNVFKHTGIEQLRFIRTELMSFSDTDVAFEGLEDTLTELRSSEAEYVAQWDWKHLRNLKRLSLIDVHSMTLESVDEPFPRLTELTALGIIRAKISNIVDNAFSNLPKLTIFNLMENDISEVKRNMLPDPARNLAIIDLSLNKISHLPEDFFSNMPRIQDVHLDNNNFVTLSEMPFSVAFKVLHEITMSAAASIFLLLCLVGILEATVCPSNEDMAPCECYFRFGFNQISCRDVLSPEDLIPPMRSIAMSKTEVLSLTIDKSSLLYLPDSLFKNTHIEKVLFVNTEIMSLSESDVAFSGLEDILTEIRAADAKFVSHWDFDQLRNLRRLNLLDVHQMVLGAVDHPLPPLPELSVLGIISAEISFVTDFAFSDLPKLTIFNMKDNDIMEMKRNMFPNPANSLAIIDLSQNTLSNLPDDFFENMPSLTDVHLDKNKFITLAEKPFSDALGNLQQLTMAENPFRCDCRMRWLVNIRFPHTFRGECSTPDALSGRHIDKLDFKSLWC